MYSPKVKTQNTQSAKICLNLNFWGGEWRVYSPKVKTLKCSKCQDLSKFEFFLGGGYSPESKLKILKVPKFEFSGEGGGEGVKWGPNPRIV